jgi:hypothetical protein
MRSSSTIVTGESHRYMAELCHHFVHGAVALLGEREGRIAFDTGEVYLRASPVTLMILADAPEPDALSALERAVEGQLKRVAVREPDLAVEWRRAPPGSPAPRSSDASVR